MIFEYQKFSLARKAPQPVPEPKKTEMYFGLSADAVEILRVVKIALYDFPEARAAVVAELDKTEKLRK